MIAERILGLVVGAIAVLVIGFGIGWSWQGARGERDLKTLQEQYNQSLLEAQERVILVEREQVKRTKEIENEHANAISSLEQRHAAAVKRLRKSQAAASSSLPHDGSTTCQHNATTRANQLPGRSGEAILGLFLEADRNTQQLLACQNWIRAQGSIN